MSGLDKVSVSVYPSLYSLTLGAQSGCEAYYVGYVWPRCPGMRLAWFRFREVLRGWHYAKVQLRSCRARKTQGGSHRLALRQGPRSCRAKNRKTQSKDP